MGCYLARAAGPKVLFQPIETIRLALPVGMGNGAAALGEQSGSVSEGQAESAQGRQPRSRARGQVR